MSIIIASYNHAHYLPHALASVFAQTYQDFEVILVDDGSVDDTKAVVSSFADLRLRYIYQPNKGLAAARNTGLQAASGEYVALLDADDLYLPEKLEAQMLWLKSHPDYGLVAGGWNLIDADGRLVGHHEPWHDRQEMNLPGWLGNCFFGTPAGLVRRSWIDKVGAFDESLRQVEDWDFWLRLAYAGCRMGWIEETVCSVRFSSSQMTRNAAQQTRSAIQMMDKFFAQPGLSPDVLSLKPSCYGHLYLVSAGREYACGQYEDAQESLLRAAEFDPRLAGKWDFDHVREFLARAYGPAFQGDSLKHIQQIFEQVPATAIGLRARQRWAMGEMGLKVLFDAHRAGNSRQVRRAATTVARSAPQRLLNRGVLSILWQSLH